MPKREWRESCDIPIEGKCMEFSKASTMWVVLFAIVVAIGIVIIVYFVGGYSHAVPQ